jgi:hypothetical protein
MTSSLFYISKGDNALDLNDTDPYGYGITSIKFETDVAEYNLSLIKFSKMYYHDHTEEIEIEIMQNQNLPHKFFTRYRDGLTNLTIVSDCNGVIIIKRYNTFKKAQEERRLKLIEENKFSFKLQKQKNKMEQFKYYKYYLQYFNKLVLNNKNSNTIVLDENRIKNFTYHNYDKAIMELFNNQSKSHINGNKSKFVGKNFNIPHFCDLILGFEIEANEVSNLTIYGNDLKIMEIIINKGINFYPLILLPNILNYINLEIFASEKIKITNVESLNFPGFLNKILKSMNLLVLTRSNRLLYSRGLIEKLKLDILDETVPLDLNYSEVNKLISRYNI